MAVGHHRETKPSQPDKTERITSDARPVRPYTPQTLADQWGCSAEKVRRMLHDGTLPSFRIGKLIRIPAAAVEEYECRMLTPAVDRP